jgi:hypothetical protein
MSDLVCLVADKNMEAAVEGLLGRPKALGIRPAKFDLLVHPRRDPGCFREAAEFLRTYRASHEHALVVLDREWEGAPGATADEMQQMLEEQLTRAGLRDWAQVVIIVPELEVWLFSDSPHVEQSLGWSRQPERLRSWLDSQGLWPSTSDKPTDPKLAVEQALYHVRKPRSSSIYRALASTVSVERCTDPSFARLKALLRQWFPLPQ